MRHSAGISGRGRQQEGEPGGMEKRLEEEAKLGGPQEQGPGGRQEAGGGRPARQTRGALGIPDKRGALTPGALLEEERKAPEEVIAPQHPGRRDPKERSPAGERGPCAAQQRGAEGEEEVVLAVEGVPAEAPRPLLGVCRQPQGCPPLSPP